MRCRCSRNSCQPFHTGRTWRCAHTFRILAICRVRTTCPIHVFNARPAQRFVHILAALAALRLLSSSPYHLEKHLPITRFFQRSTVFAISCRSLLSRAIWSTHRSRAPARARFRQRATARAARARMRFLSTAAHCSVRQERASTLFSHTLAAFLARRARGNVEHHLDHVFARSLWCRWHMAPLANNPRSRSISASFDPTACARVSRREASSLEASRCALSRSMCWLMRIAIMPSNIFCSVKISISPSRSSFCKRMPTTSLCCDACVAASACFSIQSLTLLIRWTDARSTVVVDGVP